MGVILDTCIWIECMAARLGAADIARVCGEEPVFLSAISLGELHFGAQVCADPVLRARRHVQIQKLASRSPPKRLKAIMPS